MPTKTYFIIGYFVIVLGLAIYLRIQHLELKNCHQEVQLLNSQIEKARKDFEAKQQRFEQAKKISDLESEKYQKKINDILKSKVPEDCESAIKWGVEQANDF